jgi:hypothetical protein
VIPFPACQSFPPAGAPCPLGPVEVALLEALRWWLLESRLCSKARLEEACFLLAAEKSAAARPVALALFWALGQGARRRMVFHHPGTAGRSEDEYWLLRLIAAASAGDEAGTRALIAWRVLPTSQRRVRFLLDRLVDFLLQRDLAKRLTDD